MPSRHLRLYLCTGAVGAAASGATTLESMMTIYQLWYGVDNQSNIWDLFDIFISKRLAEQQADRLEARGWRCRWKIDWLEVRDGTVARTKVRNPIGPAPC